MSSFAFLSNDADWPIAIQILNSACYVLKVLHFFPGTSFPNVQRLSVCVFESILFPFPFRHIFLIAHFVLLITTLSSAYLAHFPRSTHFFFMPVSRDPREFLPDEHLCRQTEQWRAERRHSLCAMNRMHTVWLRDRFFLILLSFHYAPQFHLYCPYNDWHKHINMSRPEPTSHSGGSGSQHVFPSLAKSISLIGRSEDEFVTSNTETLFFS